MLQTIHDKVTGWIAAVFLGAIILVFIFWGIDFKSGAAHYALKVNGEQVSIEEVRRAWQQEQSRLQQQLRGEIPDQLAKAQQSALMDQFVRETLLRQKTRKLGYAVTDQELAQRIREFPQFQVDGKFNKERYSAVLRSNGLTETQFENQMQDSMLLTQLQSGVVNSAFALPHEVDRRYALEKQQRAVDYAIISASSLANAATVTDEQIKKYYDEHADQFMLPESVDLQYVELTRAQAEAKVAVDEASLKDYYEQNKEKFTTPERRRARHILITTENGVSDADAKKKAEDLTAQAKAGADFAALAKANSKDAGSAAQGGDLGFQERGMSVGPFDDALFSMSQGEIRGPVKTQFGYHIIKLEDVQPGGVRPFDEVRAEVEADYRADRAQSIFYDESQKLADAAFSSLTELDSVAKSMNVPLKTVTGFTREGGGDLDHDPNAIEAAFSEDVLERGQNSPLVTIGEDRALVLRVTKHTPATPKPLDEVRAQIQTELKNQAGREAAAAKGADLVAQLQKGDAWSSVMSGAQLNPVGRREITRDDTSAPAELVRAAFSIPSAEVKADKPHFEGVATADGNYAVFALYDVHNGDPASARPEEKDALRRRSERQRGNEEFAAYIAEATRKAKVVKNNQVFEQ
ncbi:MAG TPA: SurA N-terminal domain-containing protein [Steroidobacteraceae bacterium]|jgi:peptidyl-prolyl cis-trans isomerase D|nr:SurA N-terminal domain-containing protein [Steroidobacteraceae bacterium]